MASPPMANPLMRPPVSRASLAPASSNWDSTKSMPAGRRPRGLSVQNRKPSLTSLNTVPETQSPPAIVTDPGTPVLEQPASMRHTSHGSYLSSDDQYAESSSTPSPPHRSSANSANSASASGGGRKRSSSIVSVQEIHETYDEQLDQEALVNRAILALSLVLM